MENGLVIVSQIHTAVKSKDKLNANKADFEVLFQGPFTESIFINFRNKACIMRTASKVVLVVLIGNI